MSDRPESLRQDLSGYVLGELSESERAAFERLLANDPALAAEAEELRRIVTRLDAVDAEAWELPAPPPLRLDPAILGEAGTARPEGAAGPARPQRKSLFSRLFGGSLQLQPALAATIVALIFAGGLGVGVLLDGDSGPGSEPGPVTSEQAVTLKPVGTLDAGAGGDARLEGDGRKIRIRVNGLSPNNPGDFYEAWLMDAKNGLVSIGSFKVGANGSAEIDVPVPVDPKAFPVVDISLEPADGAPAHSGKSVLRAELS